MGDPSTSTYVSDACLDADSAVVAFLRGKHPKWPPECACCMRPATTTKGFDWFGGPGLLPYPVCGVCWRHAWLSDLVAYISFFSGFAITFGGYYLLFGTHFLRGTLMWTGLILLAVGAALAYALHMAINKLLLTTLDSCASGESPVFRLAEPLNEEPKRASYENAAMFELRTHCVRHLKEVEAAAEDYLQLGFANAEYGKRFLQANEGGAALVDQITRKT